MTKRNLAAWLQCVVLLGLFAFLPHPASAQLAKEWRIDDQGGARDYALSESEIFVERTGTPQGTLKPLIEAGLSGSFVYEERDGRSFVKLSRDAARQADDTKAAAIRASVPGATVSPVFYQRGVVESVKTRRIASSNVLATLPRGTTGEKLAATVGARAKDAGLAGYVMLEFADPYAALDGATKLRARGVKADPQFRRKEQLKFFPNDPFFGQQWHLRNVGQGSGIAGFDANVLHAWDLTKGAGVTIAVIDDCLQLTHPDLSPASYPLNTNFNHDFNDNDNDPAPGVYDQHGTSVGGVAAARGNNSIGVSGSAPEASLVGLRLISGPITDADEAAALFWHPAGLVVGTSNNSWGPYDGGGLSGPGVLTKNALQQAATIGRNGRGLVTVFAAGNGLQYDDNSNFDGFANSRFVIAVSAVTNEGVQSYYSEPGANILVAAPSNGGTLGIFTTDVTGAGGYNPGAGEPADTNYTNSFGGTSSAAPLTTGGVALMLAANPNLGWRDVHEILASTAVRIDPTDADWVVNGGGFKFNHKYGGGMIDLTAAVIRSLTWQNLGPELSQSRTLAAGGLPVTIPDNNNTGITRNFDFSAGPNLRVEGVEVVLDIRHGNRSDLIIELTSPSGTTSLLAPLRPRPDFNSTGDNDLDYTDGTEGWTFTSTHHWGENSTGIWSVKIRDRRSGTVGSLRAGTVRLYGTAAPLQRLTFEEPVYNAREGDPSVTLRVLRLGGSNGAVSIDYDIAPESTATPVSDFTPVSGTLNFADGETTADITIPLTNDQIAENREEIYVFLRNPTGAALGGASFATVHVDDDEANSVTIIATDRIAGEKLNSEAANPGQFTISRTIASPDPLTVNYLVSGSATNGTDYSPLTGSATIPAFDTMVTVAVNVINDAVAEGSETVTLTLQPNAAYTVGTPDSATVTIVDNDLPSVQISSSPATISEAASTPVTFTVTRAGGTENALIVKLASGGTARPAINFNPVVPDRIEIPAGASSASLDIFPFNNQLFQGTLNLEVRIADSRDYKFGFNTVARVVLLENDPLPDVKRPVTRIINPLPNARIPSGTAIQASGVAGDNGSVTQVLFRLNDSAWQLATGTTNWTADLVAPDLRAGPNVLYVRSTDNAGNHSPIAVRAFSYVTQRTLNLSVVGSGTVTSGFVPSSLREGGVTYGIRATPAAGFVFDGWTGGITSSSRVLRFVMPDADTTAVAHFVPTPFLAQTPPIAGVYTGLVQATPFSFESSGMIRVVLTSTGSFTGKLTLGAAKIPLLGEFTGSGRYVGTVRSGRMVLPLDLTVDVTPGATDRVVGTVSSDAFIASISADRLVFNKRTARYPGAEAAPLVYTFVLPSGDALVGTDPHGPGFGRLTIDSAGTVTLGGKLSDGTGFTQTAPISKAHVFPLFLSLYAERGVMLGDVTIDEAQLNHDLTATVNWVKPRRPHDVAFPAGFTVEGGEVFGSRYVRPAALTRALDGFVDGDSNGMVTLSGGQLVAAIPKTVTFSTANRITVTNPGADHLVLSVDPLRGVFSGTFRHPVSQQLLPIAGVLLQREKEAIGSFRGTTIGGANVQTGEVKLQPKP